MLMHMACERVLEFNSTRRYTMKTKVCAQCKFKEMCEGLPGFCMFVPYILIASTVCMVFYFMMTSKL